MLGLRFLGQPYRIPACARNPLRPVQSLYFFDADVTPSLRVDSRKIEGVSKAYVSRYDKVSSSGAILLC